MATKKATTKAQPKAKASLSFGDLKALKSDELSNKIQALRGEVLALQRGMKNGEVQNVRAANHKRKELARALTAQHQIGEEK